MAITPEECVKITDAEVELVVKLEMYIDGQLKEKFTKIDNILVISINESLSERVWEKLISIYENVGWEVYFSVEENRADVSKPTSKFKFSTKEIKPSTFSREEAMMDHFHRNNPAIRY